MPGYERFQRMGKEIYSSVKMGSLRVTWVDDGRAFEYSKDGKRLRYDIASGIAAEATNTAAAKSDTPLPAASRRARTEATEHPDRGRQYTTAISPDGNWKAIHRDRNLWLADLSTNAPSTNQLGVTTDGNAATRVKYATANWVYGEELYQTTAMWWSPDSQKVAFYRFDESQCLDYYLAMDETHVQNRLDTEPYMKAGAPNPVVDILIYDLKTKKTVKVDGRSGKPFDNSVVGHYLYGVSWSADSKSLLFHRTNRRQNILEICAADPENGHTRCIVRDTWPETWVENLPTMRFLKDGKRFILSSERTGWKNYYLYDLTGALLATLTANPFDAEDIVRVDEPAGLLYYTAHCGDNPMKLQLRRVTLDGHGDRQITDPAFHHSVDIAPDGQHFIDIAQTHNTPPTTSLRDTDGRLLAELARSDTTKFKKLGLRPVELLQFKAADGRTDLYGMLHFPSNFKKGRKYPLLISVYAGPATVGAHETFALPSSLTEFGFLVASFDSRSASGRGKRFLDAIYQKFGIVEIDDQAAGVRSLWNRSYVDKTRVGIQGTSYGGTASATCLLRYPEVFQAACANSAVTDFRNYDSIYTERYMWIPQESGAAYDAARVGTYATNLQGRLMIFYGTADNNVHPANAIQLAQALQQAGKSFEMQVGPDMGHTAVNRDRMMEFFIQNLVLDPPKPYRKPEPPAPTKPATVKPAESKAKANPSKTKH